MKSTVYHRAHNSPSLVPILSHVKPLHTLPPYFLKIHFNIILPSMPRTSEWCVPFRLTIRSEMRTQFSSSHACYIPGPSHSPSFDGRNNRTKHTVAKTRQTAAFPHPEALVPTLSLFTTHLRCSSTSFCRC
jgi:hypothetical protein